MSNKILYQAQSPYLRGVTVEVPSQAPQIANKLLTTSQQVQLGIGDMPTNKYTGVPGILDALMDYGARRLPLNVAQDIVTLSVAEKITTEDKSYQELNSRLVEVIMQLDTARYREGILSPTNHT